MDLRNRMLQSGVSEAELPPIPIGIPITRHSAVENLNVRQRIKPDKKAEHAEFKKAFPIILSIALGILVIVMFIITATSESDNIVNYRRNITNRYAAWEQDLTEREKKVRQAEKELGIEDTSQYYENTGTD
jgi:hypothetical protein